MKIKNARLLQENATSPADFFRTHGFVLLTKKTMVKDWATNPVVMAGTEITDIYHKECDEMIHEMLFPSKEYGDISKVGHSPMIMSRGLGQQFPYYADAIHQDYGVGSQEYANNLNAYSWGGRMDGNDWKKKYDDPSVKGYMGICFWRPVNMKQPCMHRPLAVCDPNSVHMDDVIPTSLSGFTIFEEDGGTSQLQLRFNPAHQWYYYPNMTNEEVLVFKQFECFKGIDDQPDAKFKTCFHTAVNDPNTPADCEPRRSTEYRVGLWFQ